MPVKPGRVCYSLLAGLARNCSVLHTNDGFVNWRLIRQSELGPSRWGGETNLEKCQTQSFWHVTLPVLHGKAGWLSDFGGVSPGGCCSELIWCLISEINSVSWDLHVDAFAVCLVFKLLLLSLFFFMTQRTKANGFIYTQHSLLCFLSIVQVPRITSLFPRMTFRPLFSTMQTASLLSSHPVEAAMCGVAGAMYYLCERAFASRWKPTKVCLFLLALEITFTSMFPPRGALPQLWQELQLRLGHCTWLTLISMCVGYLCVFNHLTGKRNQFWKDSKLKMQHHQIINGTDLKYYSTWRSCSKNSAKLL